MKQTYLILPLLLSLVACSPNNQPVAVQQPQVQPQTILVQEQDDDDDNDAVLAAGVGAVAGYAMGKSSTSHHTKTYHKPPTVVHKTIIVQKSKPSSYKTVTQTRTVTRTYSSRR